VAISSFLLFSILFIISSYVTEKRIYAYPAILLITISYYLLLTGFRSEIQASLSLPLILIFYLTGKYLDKKEIDLAPSLYRGIYWITLYFTYYIILDMGKYFNLLGAIPLYGYSIYYLLRYIKKNRLRHGYIGLSYLSFGYLMMLYGTGPELASGKGIYLVILGAIISIIGERLHGRYDLKFISPFYTIGIILSLTSFIYSFQDIIVFNISLVIMGVSFLMIKIMIDKKGTRDEVGERWVSNIFFTIGHITAIIWGLMYIFSGFPYETIDIIVSFIYTIAYIGVGYLYSRDYLFKYRIEYAYIAGIFYTIFTYGLIKNFGIVIYINSVFLFIWLYLSYKTDKDMMIDSMNEIGSYLTGMGFIIPLYTGSYKYFDSNIGIIMSIIIYTIGYRYFGKRLSLIYIMFVLIGGLIYNISGYIGLSRILIGLIYLITGMIMMIRSIRLYGIDNESYRGFYFGWGLYSLISLYAVIPHRDIFIYFLSIIGASFIISSNFMNKKILGESIE